MNHITYDENGKQVNSEPYKPNRAERRRQAKEMKAYLRKIITRAKEKEANKNE